MGEHLKKLNTYTPELREEAVKLVLAQGLTLEEAALRLSIPKGTLANWVSAAKRGNAPKAAPGSRTVPELEAEVAKLVLKVPLAAAPDHALVNLPCTFSHIFPAKPKRGG
jgi:transposase